MALTQTEQARTFETIRPDQHIEGMKSGGEVPLQLDAVPAELLFNRELIEAEAYRLIQERQALPEIAVQPQERRDNARTALMEALTKSGHLSRVEITGASVEEINQQVLARLLNGWSDALPYHEQMRRFQEICEELVIQKTHKAIVAETVPPDTAVGIISDYPEQLDTATATQLGYRRKNKKGMSRSTHLERNPDGTYTRVIEQVSRSNGTAATTRPFLENQNILLADDQPEDVAALGAIFLYQNNQSLGGAITIQRALDSYAGPNILYGDDVALNPQHPPYEQLLAESLRRESEIEVYIDGLARLETQLDALVAARKMSHPESMEIYKEEIDRILSAICTLSPEYAADTYGEKSVAMFEQAALLVAQGNADQALTLIINNNHLKETVTFCGMAITIEKAKELGLEINSLGELIEDGKEAWKWKQGVCRVDSCPTRPGKTKVGPCSVCERCQTLFDKGHDPTKGGKSNTETDNSSFVNLLEKIKESMIPAEEETQTAV